MHRFPPNASSPDPDAVVLSGLTRHFGPFVAVDQVSLRVPRGEIFGFLGLNGAGKTTTLRMMLGMIRPTAGAVTLLGQPVGPDGQGPWDKVGYLVESPAAYPELTVQENLELCRRLRGLNDPQAIDRVISRLKLNAYAHRRAGELSLGNKQRLGLAKALLHSPELLLIDEPSNGLDPAGVVEIRTLLASLARDEGVTIFMSSHGLEEVDRLVDRIAILHRGRLLEVLDSDALAKVRESWLKVVVPEPERALSVLRAAGYAPRLGAEGLELLEPSAVAQPARVGAVLSGAGLHPSHLSVQKQSLETHFLATLQAADAKALSTTVGAEAPPAAAQPSAGRSESLAPAATGIPAHAAADAPPGSPARETHLQPGWWQALRCELLKLRRSKVPYLSGLGFVFPPLMISLMMIILRDPEAARRHGLIGQKAMMTGGHADWTTLLAMLGQAVAVGGSLVFAVCAAWLFGREFSDRTIKDLLALPTSRGAVVGARFATLGLWVGALVLELVLLGLLGGNLLDLPGAEGMWTDGRLQTVLETALLTLIMTFPVAWIASLGRGYLAPLGFALFTVFVAQVSAALGWGAWCPWAVPALHSGMGGEAAGGLTAVSVPLVLLTGALGCALTGWWWQKVDQVG